jgi:hypothetical protein
LKIGLNRVFPSERERTKGASRPTTIERSVQAVPESTRDRLKVGPGLITAATGVGGGDIVASIVVGQPFGLV